MKTILLYFSDIHLTGRKPENEGVVIKAFCEDVKQQLANLQYNDVYVLIGGDLVQAADDMNSYHTFYAKILKKLQYSSVHAIQVDPHEFPYYSKPFLEMQNRPNNKD